jgi:YVTN family beta-propeller protein
MRPSSIACGLIAVAAIACRAPSTSHVVAVSNESAGTVTLIDPDTHAVRATIPVGARPRGLRISRAGATLYVAVSGSPRGGPGVDVASLPPPDRSADGIAVVDLAARRVVQRIASGPDPEAFDLVSRDELVVSNEDAGQASIVRIGAGEIRARVAAGGEPEGVTTAPDGLVWVTSEADHVITGIDPASATVVGRVTTGQRPRSIAFTPDGALGVVANEGDASITLFDPRARAAVATIAQPSTGPMPARPMGIAMSPRGDLAYVTTGRARSIAVVDLVGRRVVRTIDDIGDRPWGIARAAGGLLYVANGSSDDVAVVDPDAGRVVARIATDASPWGVAVWP